MGEQVSFFERVALAFIAFFAVLFDGRFAGRVKALRAGDSSAPTAVPSAVVTAPSPAAPVESPAQGGALHLLSVLQRDGRLIDFLQEDVAAYSDAEVGGVARTVHEGCKKALASYLVLEPILFEPDGASVVVPGGFDAAAIRLTGNVVGSPPFRGSLKHHGWRAKTVSLPGAPTGQDPRVLAPAEVELP
jgi:hypothetical protein